MKLILAGRGDALGCVLILIVFGAWTLYIYRRQDLPKPWSWVLPLVRLAAVALLAVTLLQPVLVWTSTLVQKGVIPIIVDNSGSMGVRDVYASCQKVQIAWHLRLFPRNIRNSEFAAKALELERKLAISGKLAQAVQQARQKGEGASWVREAEPGVQNLARELQEFKDALLKLGDELRKSAEGTAYLKSSAGSAVTQKGGLSCDIFDNIPGDALAPLRASPAFPAKPSRSIKADKFTVASLGDNYGALLRGFLFPPVSGDYVFQVASDDNGELALSDSVDPGKKRKIAEVPGWTNDLEWGKYPQQTSQPVKLEAGKAYYVEAIFKEGAGGDHISVAWKRPDGVVEGPIPGSFLAPWGGNPGSLAYGGLLSQAVESAATLGREIEQDAQFFAAWKGQGAGAGQDQGLADRLARMPLIEDRLHKLAGALHGLQDAADDALAAAGVKEVDVALQKIDPLQRMDYAKMLLNDEEAPLLRELTEKGEVEIYTLDEEIRPLSNREVRKIEAKLPATRLGSTLREILKSYDNRKVSAVFVLTDGNGNAGRPVAEIKKTADERGIPIYALGLGTKEPPADVLIERVSAPRSIFVEDTLHMNVALGRRGYESSRVHITVKCEGAIVHEQFVEPGQAREIVHISFDEKKSGQRVYVVSAELQKGEVLPENNEREVAVQVLKDRIRTLIVDEFPRWETRYANMMLKRDRRIDLETLFVASMEGGRLVKGKGGFPIKRDELFAYHILVLGDVDPRHFTQSQLEDVRAFLVERGGAVILMAGPHHMPRDYFSTPLAEVLPFSLAAAAEEKANAAKPAAGVPIALSEEGKFEDLAQIGGSLEESELLWAGLPAMNWMHPGVRPTAAGEVLAQGTSDEHWPLLLKANVGLGKLLYIGSDSFWRWRYRARWKYHHRFWGQVLLWATLERTTGSDRHVKLMTDRPFYAPEESVVIKARILNDEQVPMARATASAEIRDASGKLIKNAQLHYLENSGGEYRAEVRDLPRGKYTIVPRVAELAGKDIKADYAFEVKDLPTSEYVDLTLNESQLGQLANETRPFYRMEELIDRVEKVEKREEHHTDYEVWDHLGWMLLVAGLLGFEWQMRKKIKLV